MSSLPEEDCQTGGILEAAAVEREQDGTEATGQHKRAAGDSSEIALDSMKHPTKKTKTRKKYCDYGGVFWIKKESKFVSRTIYNRKTYNLGKFFLAADAALAVDNWIRVYEIPETSHQLNFSSEESYEQARALELEKTGKQVEDVGSIDDIQTRIQKRIADIFIPPEKKNTSIYHNVNFDGSKKRYRATVCLFNINFNIGDFMLETDGAYAVDFMHNAFMIEGRERNFTSLDSYLESRASELETTGATAKSVDEIRQKLQNRLTGIKSKIVSSGIEIQKASKSKNGKNTLAAKKHVLTPLEDSHNLKFPVGCIVMVNFKLVGAKILKGDTAKITGAFIEAQTREIFYKVLYLNLESGCESNEPGLFNENQLAFAPGSPIKYTSSYENVPFIRGKVLLCHAKQPTTKANQNDPSPMASELRILHYTIMLFLPGGPRGEFEIIENVLSDRLICNREEHQTQSTDSDENEE